MAIFTCHAECEHDVQQLRIQLTRLRNAGTVTDEPAHLKGYPRGHIPDRDVVIETDRDINYLRFVMEQIPDSHVMIRTLEEGTFAERRARLHGHGG